MKKLLSILGTITIAGSGMAGLVGNAPAPAKSNINYQQTSNLETLNRVKRQNRINFRNLFTNGILDLGRIRPYYSDGYVDPISHAILERFVELNIRVFTSNGLSINDIQVSNRGDNWANIYIIGGGISSSRFGGESVRVSFDTIASRREDLQQNQIEEPISNWRTRIDVGSYHSVTNLGDIFDENSDSHIISRFMFLNQNLPNELVNILRLERSGQGSGRLFVPEGNLRYYGTIHNIRWTERLSNPFQYNYWSN